MVVPASSRRVLGMAAAALVFAAVALFAPTTSALAHGNIVNAPSRNFGCWERWSSRFQDPVMQTEDPMCWQAWQASPNAMWNWNGLYQNGLAGQFQARIPDGTLCSGGHAESGRYDVLDAVGDWTAESVSRTISLTLFDQASHGADFIRTYLTRAGYDPTTQPLGWADLELVHEIGNTPASQWTPATTPTNGVQLSWDVTASHSGRAIVYTIWQASHMDQAYFFCSDVNIS